MTSGRRDSELTARTRAVLASAGGHVFGTEPGRLAAELYDVLARTTAPAERARVAAALARCWVYGGHADRAAPLADEALANAEQTDDLELIADSLDAVLAAHWGPDELPLREATAARLDEVSARALDPEARLRGQLWGLQVGWETLRVQAIRRHLRSLEQLATESPRALFFASSRRWVYEHVSGRPGTELIAVAEDAGSEAGLADAWMVTSMMRGYTALHAGDTTAAVELAELMEDFAHREGVTEVATEAASVWALLDRPDRARSLLEQLDPLETLENLPRDVNYLLNLYCVLQAALVVGDERIVGTAARLLTPYENRAVVNAGAVYFHGVTDDVLAGAAAFAGDTERAEQLRSRALTTYAKLGATWWHDRLQVSEAAGHTVVHFHPAQDDLWLIGQDARPMRALRGFGYLHRILAHPGQAVSAIDLVTDGATVIQDDAGPQLDRQAASAYRSRLADLGTELDEATAWSDLARVETLTAEREALLAELSSAAGLSGRRRATGSTAERARVAATKAIGAAITRIEAVDPALAAHLRDAIRTGTECTYRPRPDDRLNWLLSS
ncbi:MAG TPA: hypothetical protein VGL05_07105 [Kribbella sp.]